MFTSGFPDMFVTVVVGHLIISDRKYKRAASVSLTDEMTLISLLSKINLFKL